MDERPGCAEVRELLPELAAGIAVGDERARALRHLNDCADCRRELAALAMVVDEMVTLARPVEPPGGFETSVLTQVAQEQTVRDTGSEAVDTARPAPKRPLSSRWRWRRWRALRVIAVAGLAAAVGLSAGAAATMRATADDRALAASYRQTLQAADGRYLAVRRLDAADPATIGRVFAYQGNPSWVFVVLRSGATDGSYRVHLVTRDGRDRHVGDVGVSGGSGSWGVAIDVDVEEIAEVRLSSAVVPPLTAVFR